MNQRFPWMALLLMSGLFGASICGNISKTSCDSDGIVGTFSVDGKFNDLSITPYNFTSDLRVHVTINTTIEDGNKDELVQIYMTLDQDSSCEPPYLDKYVVKVTNEKKPCVFTINWKKDTLDINEKVLVLDYTATYVASLEVRKENGKYARVVNDATGNSKSEEIDEACYESDQDGKIIRFLLEFPEPAEKKQNECGVQFDVKGEGVVTKLMMNTVQCVMVDPAGCTNADCLMTDSPTTSDEPKTDDAEFPIWAIIVIPIGALVILVVIGLIVYFFILPKKAEASDDIEEAAEAPEGEADAPEEPARTDAPEEHVKTADEIDEE